MPYSINRAYKFMGGGPKCPFCQISTLYLYQNKKQNIFVEICAQKCGYARTFNNDFELFKAPENFLEED